MPVLIADPDGRIASIPNRQLILEHMAGILNEHFPRIPEGLKYPCSLNLYGYQLWSEGNNNEVICAKFGALSRFKTMPSAEVLNNSYFELKRQERGIMGQELLNKQLPKAMTTYIYYVDTYLYDRA